MLIYIFNFQIFSSMFACLSHSVGERSRGGTSQRALTTDTRIPTSLCRCHLGAARAAREGEGNPDLAPRHLPGGVSLCVCRVMLMAAPGPACVTCVGASVPAGVRAAESARELMLIA